jgi:hypothetical protein
MIAYKKKEPAGLDPLTKWSQPLLMMIAAVRVAF